MRNDSEQLRLSLRDLARRSERSWQPVCSRFISGPDRSLCLHEAHECGISADFDGGWADAERVQCCFHPYDVEAEYTFQWVEISWSKHVSGITHRDLYGSLMGLGIDRDMFGDLVMDQGKAFVCCTPALARWLPDEWHAAGRFPIQVILCEEVPSLQPSKGEEHRDTVASLRLDCILQAALNLSRSRAADLVREGLVMVDHLPEERVDKQLKAGSLLSVRGFGRIRLLSAGEPTKKGRIPVTYELITSGR